MSLLDWVAPPVFSTVPELPVRDAVLNADFCVKRMQTVSVFLETTVVKMFYCM